MHYLKIHEIKTIQIDHNSSCNLRCPQCARTVDGKTNPDLPIDELNLNDYKHFLKKEQLVNLKMLVFCGNYGDVCVSKTFLECISWIRSEFPEIKIVINTSGSARDAEFWTKIGKIIGQNGQVNFSIDGLKDTNHMYRVNSNFEKIIVNVRSYKKTGAKARWDYLVFEHNEHQIDDAMKLAKELNFEEFHIKKTNRFINDKNYRGESPVQNKEEYNTKKEKINLKTPEQHKGIGLSQHEQIIKKYGSWNNYLNETKINCKWKPIGQIFIDFEARVWACTWTASGIYHHGEKNTQRKQARQILDYYGWDFNSLKTHTFEEILNHQYFANDFCKSWEATMDTKPIPKLLACGRTCGTDYEFSSIFGKNSEIIKIG